MEKYRPQTNLINYSMKMKVKCRIHKGDEELIGRRHGTNGSYMQFAVPFPNKKETLLAQCLLMNGHGSPTLTDACSFDIEFLFFACREQVVQRRREIQY